MMGAPSTRYWNAWLPPQVAQEAAREEPKRFAAAVHGFQAAAQAAKASCHADPNSWASTLAWIDILKSLVSTKTEFDKADVRTLITTLMDVVLSTSDDTEVQVRFGELLSSVLRTYRHDRDLELVLEWRPLYDLLQRLFVNPAPDLQGALLSHARHSTLLTLVTRCRRFFSKDAPAEIWGELRPAFQGNPGSLEAFNALGWLVLFMPTKHLPHTDPALVRAWVAEWLDLWDSVAHSSFWDSHWMYLIARTAKDDWKGVVPWGSHMGRLYTHMLWAFSVPVGTATATMPVTKHTPHGTNALFGQKGVDHADDCPTSAAKLAVHLLKQAAGAGKAGDKGEEGLSDDASSGLEALEGLVQLLEQYYHPSNGGAWSGDLASFLKQSVHHFMKQLSRQGGDDESVRFGHSPDDSEDGPTEAPAAASAAGDEPLWVGGWQGEARIVPEAQRRFVLAVSKLASRAQFSKKDSLVAASCKALCALSYGWPQQVLPLVVQRFQAALETATAMHMLPTAITTLAMCVRPMLLSGWGTEEEPTTQLIAEAMMAVLPGIDANDEAKTAAVFQFYSAVLASVPILGTDSSEDDDDNPMAAMEGGASTHAAGSAASVAAPAAALRLPLYVHEWVDMVLERIFTLLQNLDTGPGARADEIHGKPDLLVRTSYLGKETMYSPFFNHLMRRLPPPLASHVMQQLASFATRSSLASVATDAAVMFRAAATAHPALAVDQLVVPLMKRLQQDLPDPGLKSISRSLEDALTWQLGILSASITPLGGQHVLPLAPQLEALIDKGMQVSSRVAHNWTSLLLSGLVGALASVHLEPTWGLDAPLLPSGLQAWVDKDGSGFQPCQWHYPTAEHLAVAERLVHKYLEGGAQELTRLCNPGAPGAAAASSSSSSSEPLDASAQKLHMQSVICTMSAIAIGLMSRLREFEGIPSNADAVTSAAAAAAMPLSVVGSLGPVVGQPGVKNRAAAALAAAVRHLRGGDRELLEVALACSMMVSCSSMLDSLLASSTARQSKEEAVLSEEPAAAARSQRVAGRAAWRKRVPLRSAIERVRRMMMWRSGQAAFKGFTTTGCLQLEATQLPPELLELVAEVAQASTVPYSAVRNNTFPTLQSLIKRFPTLVPFLAPHYLAALAGLPSPLQSSSGSGSRPQLLLPQQDLEAFLGPQLRQAMLTAGQSESVGAAAAAAVGGAASAVAGAVAAAMAAVSGGNGAGKQSSAASESENDGRVAGACYFLNMSIEVWRHMFRDVRYFGGLLRALMASRQHTSTNCQNNISSICLQVASRFKHPRALDYDSPEYVQLQDDLLSLGEPGTLRGHWRYTVLANIYCLFLAPHASHPRALPLTRHCLALLRSDLLLLRQLANAGLWLQLAAVVDHGAKNEGLVALVDEAMRQEGFGESFVRIMVLDHARLDAAEAAKDKRGGGGPAGGLAALQAMMSMTFEEMISALVHSGMDRFDRWPAEGDGRPSAVREGLFEVNHARLIRLLSLVAPAPLLSAVREPLQRRMEQHMQPAGASEKAEQATVAEFVAGLLASGTPYAAASGEHGWVLELLQGALRSTTLELADAWAVTARYATSHLLETVTDEATSSSAAAANGDASYAVVQSPRGGVGGAVGQEAAALAALDALLAAVAAGRDNGTGALPNELKRFKAVRQMLVALRRADGRSKELPRCVRTFWGEVMGELAVLLEGERQAALREVLGQVLADVCAYFRPCAVHARGSNGGGTRNGSRSGSSTPVDMEMDGAEPLVMVLHTSMHALERQAYALTQQVLDGFTLNCSGLEAFKGAQTGAEPSGGAAEQAGSRRPSEHSDASSDVVIVDAPAASGANGEGEESNGGSVGSLSAEELPLAVSQASVALQFISCGMRGGDAAALRSVLLPMLSGVFRLQELSGPQLQQLSKEAKGAYVLLKYLPWLDGPRGQVHGVVKAVLAAGRSGFWSSRAAGMVYLQCFWFRHCFLLNLPDMEGLQAYVVARLRDAKVEVRNIAAATLSGMLKGVPAHEADQLRASLLQQATSLFGTAGKRRRGSAAAGATEAPLSEQQACVQGLKAFVMSSPYDCPPWMPGVLMALVAAAGVRAPQVKRDASKVLSEFRRTHEQDSMEELKKLMSEDDWEAMQQITSQASYYV